MSGSRARREVLRHARDVERLASRHRRRLGATAVAALRAAARDVREAAGGDEAEKLQAALGRLDALDERHLASARKSALRQYAEIVAAAVLATLAVRTWVFEPYRVTASAMVPTLLGGDQVLVNKLAYGPRIPFTTRRLVELGRPARGDVVVFALPREPGRESVKRVVGIPGDVVEIRDGAVWVNGVPQVRTPAGELSYEELNESTGRWWTDTCILFRERLAPGLLPPLEHEGGSSEETWAGAKGLATHGVLQCRRSRPAPSEGPFQAVAPGHVFVLGDNRDRSADSRSDGSWQVPDGLIVGKVTRVFWSWGRGGVLPVRGEGLRFDRLFKRIE